MLITTCVQHIIIQFVKFYFYLVKSIPSFPQWHVAHVLREVVQIMAHVFAQVDVLGAHVKMVSGENYHCLVQIK